MAHACRWRVRITHWPRVAGMQAPKFSRHSPIADLSSSIGAGERECGHRESTLLLAIGCAFSRDHLTEDGFILRRILRFDGSGHEVRFRRRASADGIALDDKRGGEKTPSRSVVVSTARSLPRLRQRVFLRYLLNLSSMSPWFEVRGYRWSILEAVG